MDENCLCWFCSNGEPDTKFQVKVELYRDMQSRYVFPNRREYTYRQLFVIIQRCEDCERVHGNAFVLRLLVSAAILITGIWGSFRLGFIVVFFIAVFASWFLGKITQSYFLKKKHIYDFSKSSVSEYGEIKSLKNEGWAIKKVYALTFDS